MTLAAILAPLLALAIVARGMGFLPLLGAAAALDMLVAGQQALNLSGAVLALVFSILPPVFLLRYQVDSQQERSRVTAPFLALGLMVLLLLTSARAGMVVFPSGLCVIVAGLVAVVCRQGMIWQWAGLQACVQGALMAGVAAQRGLLVGVAGVAGVVVLVQGGLCIHRVLPRLSALRATGVRRARRPEHDTPKGDSA